MGLRELEDKMRVKRLHHAEIVRKIERMIELVKDEDTIKSYGIHEFKLKLSKFEHQLESIKRQ